VKIWVEQEPGSGGKESAENTITRLAGFVVHADRVTGDKEARAEPFAIQVEAGNVDLYIPGGKKKGTLKDTWVGGDDGFLHECELFPMGKFSDQVDAAAGAFNKLTQRKKIVGMWGTKRKRKKRGGRIRAKLHA
jgi:phage terminase large subunit-like protein